MLIKRIGAVLARRVLALLVAGLACEFAHAQCTDNLDYQTYLCVYGTCRNKVTVGMVGEEGFDYHYSCDSVSCCGQLFTDCYIDGGCDSVSPAQRKRIAQIAESARVLVADCKGRYQVFRDAPGIRAHDLSALMDDRVLR